MPITRAQADSMVSRLRLTFEGTDGDLNITYRPNLLSRSEFRRMQELAEGSEDDDTGLAPLLSRVIVGWDFLQGDGQPYPVDGDALDLLGYPVQIQIVKEMVGGPTPTNGRKSPASSAERRILPPIESSISSPPATGTSMSGY